MTGKKTTFAGQLKGFAQSVDIVDDNKFNDVRDLVYQYMRRGLYGEYFELLQEESVGENGERRSYLRTFWSSEDPKSHQWQLHPAEARDVNPVTEAFVHDRPMWLVSPDKGLLHRADNPIDLWSQSTNLPP